MRQFAGKVVLVTGGNAGIGRAAAIEFARQGAQVVVGGRREKEGLDVIAEIKALGGNAIFVKTDVSKERDVKAMVEQTLATFGRLHYAFNNAGIEQVPTPLPDQTEVMYDQIMDINVKGVWLSLKHEIPAMLQTGGGAIVNNASIGGLIGFAMGPIYVASKHAVIGLTKAVALEYATQQVRVNAVAPGPIETRMFRALPPEVRQMLEAAQPMGRIGQPDEIASAVVWLCSDGDLPALTHQEVTQIVYELLFAGHETTTGLIGNAMRRLLTERHAWEEICGDAARIPNAIEEVLRFDSSVIAWRRKTTEAVEIGGVPVPADANLLLLLGSANRDPAVFEDPDRFDIHRQNAKEHLAFGHGAHFCLGAPLGRLETRVVLEELSARLPSLRLVPGQTLRFQPNTTFRGPLSLLVEWDKRIR